MTWPVTHFLGDVLGAAGWKRRGSKLRLGGLLEAKQQRTVRRKIADVARFASSAAPSKIPQTRISVATSYRG